MKKLLISLSFLFCTGSAFSQAAQDTLVVAPGSSGLYFYHVMKQGESLSQISKRYNISKQKILAVNNNKKIAAYEIIKVPLKDEDIVQSGSKAAHADLQPLYHKVSKKETLFRIGKLYSNISLKDIKTWNNLQGNTIHPNQYLIVGWFNPRQSKKQKKEKESSSRDIAAANNNKPHKGDSFLKEVISSERKHIKKTSYNTKEPVSHPLLTKNTEHQQKKDIDAADDAPTTTKPLLQKTTAAEEKEKQNSTSSGKPKKEEKKSKGAFENMLRQITHPPEKKTSSVTSVSPSPTPATAEDKPIKDTLSKVSAIPTSKPTSKEEKKKDTASLKLAQKSIFSGLFNAQTQDEELIKSKKGAAGWFKSNIQPGSKKYYALCDHLPRGTIIKVINPINNKFIFAKVLSPIPKSKENYNLIVKLSDAAKDDLGISQSRFWSKIVFPKTQ